jgi:N-acetylglucosamine malate deacetylase 1
VAMLACERSQVFEWLPYVDGILDEVPAGEAEKLVWLRRWYSQQVRRRTERFRPQLIAAYGPDRYNQIEAAEMYEISEYAFRPDKALRQRLFPTGRFVD